MRRSPEQTALVCIEDDGSEQVITRGEFFSYVQNQAHANRLRGMSQGDVGLILLPHGPALFATFWSVLLLGATPMILAYPQPGEDRPEYFDQLEQFALSNRCDWLLAPSGLCERLADHSRGKDDRLIRVQEPRAAQAAVESPPALEISSQQTAFVQFSSGTTGAKKGIVISHQAMVNYLSINRTTMQLSEQDVVVSWLPLNHDMGLIACFVVPLTNGIPAVMMSPRHWLSNPVSLLRAVHRHQGTITAMPNFAFSYCTNKISEEELRGIDLSSWRLLICGAEPVQEQVLRDFTRRFGSRGLRDEAVRVGYGMAECVLGVSRTPLGRKVRVDWIERQRLARDGRALPCERSRSDAGAVVSCGIPHPTVEIEILSAEGSPLGEREVGEIRIKSSSLFSGYYLQPELTRAAMSDGWFRTGDLGYLSEGELFICGRKKDLIISFGRSIFPEDLERIAESFPESRRGRTVAFGIDDPGRGTEKAVLLCELRPGSAPAGLAARIREKIWGELEIMVADIEFVEPGWVVKTTSGKLARSANREKYLKHQTDC